MKDKKQERTREQGNKQRDHQQHMPKNQQVSHKPGEDAVAKTSRKGAGQQQNSGGNPVVNS